MVKKECMKLFDLVNQDKNREFLTQAVENDKIANGYLFYGPEGSGSEGFAMEFAAMLNCQSDGPKPCGQCSSCKKMKKLEHGNVTLLYPIPAVGKVKEGNPISKLSKSVIEDIQDQIQEKAANPYAKIILEKANKIPISLVRYLKRTIYLSAPEKGWKVVIVFDAHKMNKESANSFLKILEEPPKNTTIILSTSKIGHILPTIKSRCKPLYFSKLHNEDLEKYLNNQNFSEEEKQLMINLADGNITSLNQLMTTDIKEIKTTTLALIRAIAGWSRIKIYKAIPKLVQIQRNDSERFIQILTAINFWFRDAEMIRQEMDTDNLIHYDQRTSLKKFVDNYPDFDAYHINQAIDNCIDFISRNVYINASLMDMFFKIKKLIGNRN